MNIRSATLVAALVASLLQADPAAAQSGERLFYYVDQEAAWNSLVRNVSRIDIIAPSAYNVLEDGVVWGDVDPRVLALAKQHDVAVWPLLVNRGFNQERLHRFLEDETAMQRAIAAMVELSRRHGYAGFQIDFENLSINDRDAFTRFYRDAARALRAAGFGISAAVVHRPDELPGVTQYQKWLFDSWRGGYDLTAMAEVSDFISIMSYNQHTRRTPPGPQAGLPWMEDVIRYFRAHVPPEKLSLGIATNSQHWYTSYDERIQPELARSYSAQLTHAWARSLIERNNGTIHWDDTQKVAYSYFPVGGTFEWIFLEDARSFRARLDLVQTHGLRGFSVWVLGVEDEEIWEALAERR